MLSDLAQVIAQVFAENYLTPFEFTEFTALIAEVLSKMAAR